jgi:hypothetical protein
MIDVLKFSICAYKMGPRSPHTPDPGGQKIKPEKVFTSQNVEDVIHSSSRGRNETGSRGGGNVRVVPIEEGRGQCES